MTPVVVLLTFYSRCGATEKLASSAAVGAVQARANIRLRRVPDASAQKVLEAFPDCREALLRMHKEYVPPAEADVVGADAIVLASPPGVDRAAAEWADFLGILARLSSEGKLAGKVGAVVEAGREPPDSAFAPLLGQFGLALPSDGAASREAQADPAARATEVGRTVVSLVRQLRQGTQASDP